MALPVKSNSLAKIVHVLTWKQMSTDCLMETTFMVVAGNTCTSISWEYSCTGRHTEEPLYNSAKLKNIRRSSVFTEYVTVFFVLGR